MPAVAEILRDAMNSGRHVSPSVQWWWIVLLGAALAAALLLTSSTSRLYRATSTLIVVAPNETAQKSAATTYADMARSPKVLQRVSEMLGIPVATTHLPSAVS